jgi:hypothetical protein
MRKTREILHLRLGEKLPLRTVAQSCNCSASRVHEVTARAVAAGLSWPLTLNDEELEARLYSKPAPESPGRPEPDYQTMHLELGKRGVTLSLLWQEHRAVCPTGYGYSQFCSKYRGWRNGIELSMRQTHAPGEKVFVDFAGHTMPVYDRATGECVQMQIFVAAMGLSQYIYTEAVGKTAAEFSREQGLNVKSLYAWSTTLQTSTAAPEAQRKAGVPRLVPVTVGKWADATSEEEKEQSSSVARLTAELRAKPHGARDAPPQANRSPLRPPVAASANCSVCS